MIKPTSRNLLLEVQEVEKAYAGGLIAKPESSLDGCGGLIVIDKASNCILPIPLGAEVVVDYESEDLKQNIMSWGGKRYFIIREDFVMAYFDPEVILDAEEEPLGVGA